MICAECGPALNGGRRPPLIGAFRGRPVTMDRGDVAAAE